MRLKGHKHEKFVAGIFTQIRPVWTGENETRPKTSKNKWLGFYIFILMAKYFLLAMSATALLLFRLFSSYDEKKLLFIASKYTSVGLGQR